MSRIYQYQTYVRIELTTGVAISNPLEVEIRYSKPSGESGVLPATVLNPLTGIIYHDLAADSSGGSDFFDETGIWKFWAWVMFSDGRVAPGEPYKQRIYAEGV